MPSPAPPGGPRAALRPARPGDAPVLARLVDMAGEGLPRHLWSQMAAPGESVWEVGARRARRESGAFSWRNATIAEVDGQAAAGLVGYALAETAATDPLDEMPPIFRPLEELERLAPGTWYVNVLATVPEHRGTGLGRLLLGHARSLASEGGRARLSLVVADTNAAARGLYAATGFAERARRPVVRNGWASDAENWILMVA